MDWLGRSRPQGSRQNETTTGSSGGVDSTGDPFPAATIEVELLSDTYSIQGMLVTRHRRLTDVLLETYLPAMSLRNAVIRSWHDEQATTQQVSSIQINKSAVVCAIPSPSSSSSAAGHDQTLMRVHKTAHRVLLSTPPFEIRGELHLIPGSSSDDALTVLQDAFIPITNAEIVFLPKTSVKFDANVVVVNRARVQFMATEGPDTRPRGTVV